MSVRAPGVVSLAGMMGSGKSTVAAELGRLLRLPVVSTDAEIVRRARKPIARVFAEEGEPAFRALERHVVAGVRGPCVLDLGGGAFCDPGAAARLLRLGTVFFLDVSPGEAARRLGGGGGVAVRPLAAGWEPLLRRRLPLYRRALYTVRVDGLSPEAIAGRIHGLLRMAGGAR